MLVFPYLATKLKQHKKIANSPLWITLINIEKDFDVKNFQLSICKMKIAN